MKHAFPVCYRRMHEELKSAGGSARLASQVASCISKALQLLAEKAEYMAATGVAHLLRPAAGFEVSCKSPLCVAGGSA